MGSLCLTTQKVVTILGIEVLFDRYDVLLGYYRSHYVVTSFNHI